MDGLLMEIRMSLHYVFVLQTRNVQITVDYVITMEMYGCYKRAKIKFSSQRTR